MHCAELRILNFRSIRSQQTVPLSRGAVLVGANNVGKSNILRAIQLFFESTRYSIDVDRPHQAKGRTSLRAVFSLDEKDDELWADYLSLHEYVEENAGVDRLVPIYLEFSRAGNGSYKLFPNQRPERGKQSDFSRRQHAFVQAVLGSFAVRYVPSAKDWDAFYANFLVPALGEVIEEEIKEQLDGVRSALATIGTTIGTELQNTVGSDLLIDLSLSPDLAKSLGAVTISMKDPTPTDLSGKGQGIQSAFLTAAIGWISQREKMGGKTPIWLLEEPEAYTHPELARGIVQLVDSARDHGPVVFTTHSLSLIPADQDLVRGVDRTPDGGTHIRTFDSHAEATRAIREALGVKAADYFGFGAGVILTEGPSDRSVIEWALGLADPEQFPLMRRIAIHDCGGVKELAGFLSGTLAILQGEVPAMALIDGDEAGQRQVRALASRFANSGVRWEPNRDYVVLPNGRPIEGLFPDEWIIEAYAEEPNWFEEPPTLDVEGNLVGFGIRRKSARAVREWLQERGESDPGSLRRIFSVMEAIESGLSRSAQALDGN
jgi:hypothetical protein